MLEHIVKNGQTINDIIDMYHLTLEEVKKYNQHITNLDYIIPGTKIIIPILTEEVKQILEGTESFVMDYYPKIEKEFIEEKVTEKKIVKVEENLRGKPYPGIVPPKSKYQ